MLKYIIIQLVLFIPLIGCAQPSQNSTKTTVSTNTQNHITGDSFNTIAIDNGNKTLACINYSGAIKEGVFITLDDFDETVEPVIREGSISTNAEQLKLCHDSFNSHDYTHTSVSSIPFEYTTNGYVFKKEDINLIQDGNNVKLDINGDKQADYLQTCSSMEGEHLNIWVDKRRNNRLAYAYRYIDADLVETCRSIDYPLENKS